MGKRKDRKVYAYTIKSVLGHHPMTLIAQRAALITK